MILKSLILFFSIHAWSGPQFPPCYRPKDFSLPNVLKNFEVCQNKQRAYCDKFEKDMRCRVFLKNPQSYMLGQVVSDDCRVQRNGQYRCKEKPLRFFEKGAMPQPQITKPPEEKEGSSLPVPTPSPSASSSPLPETPSPN